MLITTDTIEKLLRQHHKMMLNIAYKITYNSEAAKDIVQDVLLKIWNKKDTVKADVITKNYMYKAVVNTSLDYLKKNKKIQQLQPHAIEQLPTNANTPEEILTLQELQEKIDESIALLPPKCKTIFVLSRFEEMKHRQIAELLNISQKTVENQMSIALKKLRADLKPYLTKEFLSAAATVGFSALLHLLALSLLADLFRHFF